VTRKKSIGGCYGYSKVGLQNRPAARYAKTYQGERESSTILQIYVNGLWEGISWTEAKIGPNRQKQIYCPPKGLVVSGPEIKEMLDNKAQTVSSDDGYPVAFVVFDALNAMYPCKK
jgi:hypothetical protein